LIRLGYKASAEQFAPQELLDFAVHAEAVGLDSIFVSDHFQPFRHTGGHSPNSLVWLGALAARTTRAQIGTSVLTPTIRYYPAVVAQAFATLGCLAPGRVTLGVGAGEAMNELAPTAADWGTPGERLRRLQEAVRLIEALFTGERVSFDGRYFATRNATIYDRPDERVPILVAAGGPKGAAWAGANADGFIQTSGKPRELYAETLLPALDAGAREAGRDPATLERMIEIKLSYHPDLDAARRDCAFWAPLSLPAEAKKDVDDPVELERLADAPGVDATSRFIVTDDPDEAADRISAYVELGFEHLVVHSPAADQAGFLERFAADLAPRLRTRHG
jgi:coenzyme F420-dependent glucose-6-phosphate dehydrogenase